MVTSAPSVTRASANASECTTPPRGRVEWVTSATRGFTGER